MCVCVFSNTFIDGAGLILFASRNLSAATSSSDFSPHPKCVSPSIHHSSRCALDLCRCPLFNRPPIPIGVRAAQNDKTGRRVIFGLK